MYTGAGDNKGKDMDTLDLQPTLIGETITLRPVENEDFEALYEAASDPLIWEQHPDILRYQRDVFRDRFFQGALECGGALVVVENETGSIVGSSRYYEWDPDKRELAIGYTFLERKHWGTITNTEMKQLMLDHAFTQASRVWFHVGESNMRSRRAVEKLGATLSYSEQRELDGTPFVQLYYQLDAPI